MKKSLGLLAAGTLVFTAAGALAFTFAKDEAPKEAKAISGRVVVNGTNLMASWTAESHNPVTYNGSSGSATLSYEEDTYVLYLNQFQIESNGWKPSGATSGYQSIIDVSGLDRDLYVKLNGNSVLTHKGAESNFTQCGMNLDLSSVNTYFQLKEDASAGSLVINTKQGSTTDGTDGLVCKGSVEFSNVSIETHCKGPRIRSMYFAKKVTVNDGADLSANCENVSTANKSTYGIYHASSSDADVFTVEGGHVYAKGAYVVSDTQLQGTKNYGIHCGKFVQNGGEVEFYGGRANYNYDSISVGMYIHSGQKVNINGGTFRSEGFNPSSYCGSFGIYDQNFSTFVQVQGEANFEAVGWTEAVDCNFITLKTAEGWESATSTAEGTLFGGNNQYQDVSDYRRIKIYPIKYTVNHDSVAYDGEAHAGASVTINEENPDAFTVRYKKSTEADSAYKATAPTYTDIGTYYVDIKVSGPNYTTQKERVEFQITKGTNSYVTEPSAKVLTYNGALQDLVNAGIPSGGKVLYKLGDGEYGESVPQAQNVGTYVVWYKVDGSPNYDDIAERSVEVTIAKGTNSYVTEPSAKELTYNGALQDLVNAGIPSEGKVLYKLGDGEYGESVPQAQNAGTYVVWYKVDGSPNYEDIAEKSVEVTIAKATAVYSTLPAGKENLVENDEAQELIVAGVTDCGTPVYRLGTEGEFTEAIPAATAAGEYTVQYKILGDDNYLDSEVGTLTVSIAAKPTPPGPTPGGGTVNAGLPAGAIVGIVLGSVLLVLCGAYFLLFFVFNKWIKGSSKPQRVFKLKVEGMRVKLLTMNFRVIERFECDVYDTREEARNN